MSSGYLLGQHVYEIFRGSIAVNPALWRCQLRASDPRTGSGSVSTLSFWPLSPIPAYTLYTWVIARAATIPDLGYCRSNRRDCCGLPIIGRRADNPPLRLHGFLCSPGRTLILSAPLRAATAKFLSSFLHPTFAKARFSYVLG